MKFFLFKKKSKSSNKKQAPTNNEQEKRAMVDSSRLPTVVLTQAQNDSRAHSPSHSISSSSTQSSIQTIQHSQEQARGIFRTLEPVWSYLPNRHDDQWILLSNDNQRLLESVYNAKEQTKCTISLNDPLLNGAFPAHRTDVYFYPKKSPPPTPTEKKRRHATHLFTSSSPCFTQQPQHMQSSPNLTVYSKVLPSDGLYLHQNLRRVLVPYWWFEQDKAHMARFDPKNQVLLEALSEGRSTLTLTDMSFPVPFQVILEQTNRALREECCGFMYLTSHIPPKHTIEPIVVPHKENATDHDDIFLNRRCSI